MPAWFLGKQRSLHLKNMYIYCLLFLKHCISACRFCVFFIHSLIHQSLLPTLLLCVYQSNSPWKVLSPRHSIHRLRHLAAFLKMSAINLGREQEHCMCSIHICPFTADVHRFSPCRIKVCKKWNCAVKAINEAGLRSGWITGVSVQPHVHIFLDSGRKLENRQKHIAILLPETFPRFSLNM